MKNLPDMNATPLFVMLEVPSEDGQSLVQCQLHNYQQDVLDSICSNSHIQRVIAAKSFTTRTGVAAAGDAFVCDSFDEAIDMRTYCAEVVDGTFGLAMDITLNDDLETAKILIFTQEDVAKDRSPIRMVIPIPDFLKDGLADVLDGVRKKQQEPKPAARSPIDGWDYSEATPGENCYECERTDCPEHPSQKKDAVANDGRKELSELLARLSEKVLEA